MATWAALLVFCVEHGLASWANLLADHPLVMAAVVVSLLGAPARTPADVTLDAYATAGRPARVVVHQVGAGAQRQATALATATVPRGDRVLPAPRPGRPLHRAAAAVSVALLGAVVLLLAAALAGLLLVVSSWFSVAVPVVVLVAFARLMTRGSGTGRPEAGRASSERTRTGYVGDVPGRWPPPDVVRTGR